MSDSEDEGDTSDNNTEPIGRRAQRRAFRTDEILRTALELVQEGGLDAVRTTELAKRTGAALGALYRFFPSKQAVIQALQERALAELARDLDAAIEDAAARAKGATAAVQAIAPIVAVADTFFDLPRTQPSTYRLLDELISRPDPIYVAEEAKAMEATVRPILLRVAQLATALPEVNATDAARIPLVVWGGLHGILHFLKRDRIADEQAPRAKDAAGALMRTLLRGWGASQNDIDAAIALRPPKALTM